MDQRFNHTLLAAPERNRKLMAGRTIIIGDVHGCLRELERLLERLEPGTDDEIIFLGDLINKGPDSAGVVRCVRKMGARSLLGNHEARILRHVDSGGAYRLKKPDWKTFKSLGPDEVDFFRTFPLTIPLPEYNAIAVHGGFLPHPHWSQQPEEVVAHIQVIDRYGRPRKRSDHAKGRPWAEFWKGPETVIYGHTPRRTVFRRPFSIGIDTACVFGGTLTAFIYPEATLCQVKAARHYADL